MIDLLESPMAQFSIHPYFQIPLSFGHPISFIFPITPAKLFRIQTLKRASFNFNSLNHRPPTKIKSSVIVLSSNCWQVWLIGNPGTTTFKRGEFWHFLKLECSIFSHRFVISGNYIGNWLEPIHTSTYELQGGGVDCFAVN